MHPVFIERYGKQLLENIRILAAYHGTKPPVESEDQLATKETELEEFCRNTDISYSGLLSFAQNPYDFPYQANEDLTRFCRFYAWDEPLPYVEVSLIKFKPETGKSEKIRTCGNGVWIEKDVFATALFNPHGEKLVAYKPAIYLALTNEWKVVDQALSGQVRCRRINPEILEYHDSNSAKEFTLAEFLPYDPE